MIGYSLMVAPKTYISILNV